MFSGILLGAASGASATTITYDYTGQSFVHGGVTQSITGTISYNTTPTYGGALATPDSFYFTDNAGGVILKSGDAGTGIQSFNVTTDSNGAITSWDIQVGANPSQQVWTFYLHSSGGDSQIGPFGGFQGSTSSAGSFSGPTQTPEPSTLVAGLSGLIAVMGLGRKRRKTA